MAEHPGGTTITESYSSISSGPARPEFGTAPHPTTGLGIQPRSGPNQASRLLSGSASPLEAPLPAERVVHILKQVAKSIAEAHDIGLIHRDVKPDNVFLSDIYGERDFVKVLDFGIAKIVNDEELANLTQTGFICGTPT